MHRIAFDPALPVVAASPFMAAGRSFASGEPVDWRSLGIDEQVLYDWWRTGQVSFIEASAAEAAPAPVEQLVEQPKQQRFKRR